MKKLLIIAGLMAAAAIAFTGCRIETSFESEILADSFSISASLGQDTKTTNSGMSTLWEAKDSVCVFYSTSPGVYTGGKGTIQSGAKTTHATFQVEGTAPTGNADWYMLFPYNKDIATPGEREEGWTYIGHSKGAEQAEYDDTKHLARSLCPMYGVAKDVDAANVNVQMHQLASVIEFVVTNNSGLGIDELKSISVTASEDIVGSYFIDITGETPVYTPTGESFVSPTASVTVKKPGYLELGQSAKLYLPIKPFTQNSHESFVVEVNCNVGGVAKFARFEIIPSGGQAVFSAGKIKTVQINLTDLKDKLDSVEYAFASASGTPVVLAGVVTSVFPKGFFVQDDTGAIFVYQNAAPTVTPGTAVRIVGKTSTNSHHIQVSNSDLTVTETGTGSVERTPASWSGADVEAAYEKYNNVAYVSVVGTALSAARLSVEGTATVLSIDVNHRAEGVSFTKGKTYSLTGYVYGYAKNGEELQVCLYAETAETEGGDNPNPPQEATLKLNGKNSETLTFDCAPTGPQTVSVTCDNTDWTVTGTPDWASVEVDKSASTITVTVSENTGELRSAELSVNHSNGQLTRTLKIVQSAPSSGEDFSSNVTWSLDSSAYSEKAYVNGTADVAVLKLGTSSKAGKATLTFPEGATSLTFYAVSWNGAKSALVFKIGDTEVGSIEPEPNSGLAGNSPYTLAVTDSDKYTINFSETTTVTVETSGSKKRAAIFAVVAK